MADLCGSLLYARGQLTAGGAGADLGTGLFERVAGLAGICGLALRGRERCEWRSIWFSACAAARAAWPGNLLEFGELP